MIKMYTSCTYESVVPQCRLALLPVSPLLTAELQMPSSPSEINVCLQTVTIYRWTRTYGSSIVQSPMSLRPSQNLINQTVTFNACAFEGIGHSRDSPAARSEAECKRLCCYSWR